MSRRGKGEKVMMNTLSLNGVMKGPDIHVLIVQGALFGCCQQERFIY